MRSFFEIYFGSERSGPFATGDEAAKAATAKRKETGNKWLVRPISTIDWKKREQKRFADGTYKRLPHWWTESYWWGALSVRAATANHFPHIALGKSSRIAFTASDAQGVADRQTVTTAGKYLTKFCTTALATADINRIADRFAAEFDELELQIATTAAGVVRAYKAISSCMQFRNGGHDGHCHPARAYAGPDLAVAYLERNGQITSRCVVWPAKKLFMRIYGDNDRMQAALERAGYKCDRAAFKGARLRCIADENNDHESHPYRIIPYIDSGHGLAERGGHLVLVDAHEMEYPGNSQSGTSERMIYCSSCCEFAAWHGNRQHNGRRYCAACARRYFGRCDHAGQEVFSADGFVSVIVGRENGRDVLQTWSHDAAEAHAFYDSYLSQWHLKTATVESVDGITISTRQAVNHGGLCQTCHGIFTASHVSRRGPNCSTPSRCKTAHREANAIAATAVNV